MRFWACLIVTLPLLAGFAGCTDSPTPKSAGSTESGGTSVQVALNWYPEAEHGGYYAAEVGGAYADQQLQVEIIPGRPGAARLILQELATGRVDFAVSNADQVVEQRAKGLPIVALLAPLQKSPRCIMVHQSSGFESLEQLADVELAISDTRPFALWMKHKLPLTNVTMVPFNGLVGEFLSKPQFAQQAYVFSEPFIAQEKGGDPAVLMVSDIGFNPYASVLVTTEETIQNRPEIVSGMVTACRQGWETYLQSPETTNQMLHKVNEEMSPAALEFGAEALQDLCQTPEGTSVGQMQTARWQELIDQLVELKVIPPGSVQAADCFHTDVDPSR